MSSLEFQGSKPRKITKEGGGVFIGVFIRHLSHTGVQCFRSMSNTSDDSVMNIIPSCPSAQKEHVQGHSAKYVALINALYDFGPYPFIVNTQSLGCFIGVPQTTASISDAQKVCYSNQGIRPPEEKWAW